MDTPTNFEDSRKISEAVLISQRIIPYLRGLGYRYLNSEVKVYSTTSSSTADVVVYLDEAKSHPYIIVEVKQKLSNEIELLDPVVQTAFVKATAMGKQVRYLLITDGQKHFWFERSSEGRSIVQLGRAPENLPESQSILSEVPLITVEDPQEFSKLMYLMLDTLRQDGMAFGVRMGIELNRILIAKLQDERVIQAGGPRRFRASNLSGHQITANIAQLYEEAFINLKGKPVEEKPWFFSPHALSNIVKILEPYALLPVTDSIRGHLFWQMFAQFIRMNETVFTTPVPLADFLVRLTQPRKGQRIIDPACGTGLLLIMALEIIKEQAATNNLFSQGNTLLQKEDQHIITGIEVESEVAELAATNLVLNGISPGNIIITNALDKHNLGYFGVQLSTYDTVVLHPPIGSVPNDENILSQYKIISNNKRPTMEMLFIELAIDLLRPGGLLVSLVPDTFLSSPSYQSARSWLLQRTIPRAIVSLPPETLMPIGYSGKTTILLLEKKTTQQNPQDRVLVADVQSIGYNRFGHPTGENVLPDLLEVFEAYRQRGEIENSSPSEKIRVWTISTNDLSPKRLDIGQFDPTSNDLVYALKHGRYPFVKLNEIVNIISGRNFKTYVEYAANTAILIQAGAVRDLTLDLSNAPSISAKDFDGAKSAHIEFGDILVTTTGTYLGRACVFNKKNQRAVASGAVTILRPQSRDDIDPFFLTSIINSKLGKEQILQLQATSAAQPYIRRADLGTITIPLPPLSKQKELAQRIKGLLTEAQDLARRAQEIETEAKKLIVDELLGVNNNE